MAERRMFTKKITNSDAFIDMPLSTQALYFHLNMEADDDGFNSSPKKIQRMIGASDDDLKLLFAKNFVIPFESGVVVIKHWKLHNYIQNDRYKETVYIEEKKLLETKENKVYTLMDTNCTQNGYTDKDSIDKNRIDKDSIDKKSIEESKKSVPYDEILNLYHTYCPSLPKVLVLNDNRKKSIKARYKEYKEDLGIFEVLFSKAEESDFLKGNNPRGWKANFDWLIKASNMPKVIEDNYANNKQSAKSNDGWAYIDDEIDRIIEEKHKNDIF